MATWAMWPIALACLVCFIMVRNCKMGSILDTLYFSEHNVLWQHQARDILEFLIKRWMLRHFWSIFSILCVEKMYGFDIFYHRKMPLLCVNFNFIPKDPYSGSFLPNRKSFTFSKVGALLNGPVEFSFTQLVKLAN